MMLMRCLFHFFNFFFIFHFFFIKSICCRYPFELHRLASTSRCKLMQFKRVPTTYAFIKKYKKYTGSNLKTTELLDCAPIGVCVAIRSNTVALDKKGYQVLPPQKHIFWVFI